MLASRRQVVLASAPFSLEMSINRSATFKKSEIPIEQVKKERQVYALTGTGLGTKLA
jgi:hypothetical protein